jgi:hypothetical protein
MISGLHFQGHACRTTIEFDLLVLSNTVISFVVVRCWVKDMFGFVSLVLSRYIWEGKQINWLANEHRHGEITIESPEG